MIKKFIPLLLFGLLPLRTFAQSPEQAIQKIEVERILKTLSSDEMEGRATFTPGIDKAAAFIAGEFQRIGLEPIKGQSDYRQAFEMYSLTPTSKTIKLDKKAIASNNFYVITSKENLSWKTGSKVKVELLEAEDDFRQKLRQINASKEDMLVIIDPAHKTIFDRYQNYFGNESRHLELGKGKSIVMVLSETKPKAPKTYNITIKNKVSKLPLANVAGQITGKRADEFVLFSAHYDHLGFVKSIDGDSIANGADDDASGVTAVITLADYFKKQPQPERTLLFVTFTAEEVGGYGSQYFSKKMDPEKIAAMINVEMIGKGSKFGPNTAYLTGFDKSDLGELLQKSLEGSQYAIHPDPYPEQNLFYRSDNATLARLGVPAHTLSSVQIANDSLYHSVDDEFESLDVEHMTNMIRAIAKCTTGIVQGTATPRRVDKAMVE